MLIYIGVALWLFIGLSIFAWGAYEAGRRRKPTMGTDMDEARILFLIFFWPVMLLGCCLEVLGERATQKAHNKRSTK